MRGATSWTKLIVHFLAFQPTRPLRGATAFEYSIEPYYKISTHAPLAGRDQGRPKQLHGLHHFNPRAPCGARRGVRVTSAADQISTHAPLAGRDTIAPCAVLPRTISTHAPLAGRDRGVFFLLHAVIISTHAPLAGRDATNSTSWRAREFQPTRPLRGATLKSVDITYDSYVFQPTRPLRGATRLLMLTASRRSGFQPTRPLRGATALARGAVIPPNKISTHAPLAGRDSKSVQITMHIFAITDKFQMLLHRMPPVRAFCSFLMQENHADFGCEQPK